MTFPPLLLAIAFVAVLGPGLTKAMTAVGIVFAPRFARLVRGLVLAVREETFIEASRSIGTPTPRIIRRHILPNIMSPLVVQISLALGFSMLAEAALSFLGLGVRPPQSSWGSPCCRTPTAPSRKRRSSPSHQASPSCSRCWRSTSSVTASVTRSARRSAVSVDQRKDALLDVQGLCVDFYTDQGWERVVNDVSFHVGRGETLGIVGESGSGKSVTCMALTGLIPMPPGRVSEGTAMFDGRDLVR
jgi:peptide/nickel transport system permease protein